MSLGPRNETETGLERPVITGSTFRLLSLTDGTTEVG